MAERIPTSFVDEVRQKTNIVDVISQYVQLQKKGKNFFGLCPFHEERTPSFSVSEDKQIFHCFSCGRGGNVFNFLMDLDQLSFPESVTAVAKLEGIPMPTQYTATETISDSPLKKMYRQAQEMYHHILIATATGETGLQYLQKRRVTDETIKKFSLGYAPDSYEILYQFLKQQGYQEDQLVESGLFIKTEDGRLLDRFRDRLMFPLLDQGGQIVGFSGRRLSNDESQAKYLNSPETALFNKSKLLFNFDEAKKAVKNEHHIVLFEGYMDVISAYQAGVKSGVASMGTSLTDQQLYLIRRINPNVVICYDGDDPGQRATMRALKMIEAKGQFKVSIVSLPEKKDPDEYVKAYGPEKFQNEIAGAITPTEFKLNTLEKQFNLSNDRDKLAYTESALNVIGGESSPIAQELFLNKVSEAIGVSLSTLKSQLLRTRRRQRLTEKNNQLKSAHYQQGSPEEVSQQTSVPALQLGSATERRLLFLKMHFEEVSDYLITQNFHFSSEIMEKISNLWDNFKQTTKNGNIANFIDTVPIELKGIIADLEMMETPENYSIGEIDDYLQAIAKKEKLGELEQLRNKLNDAKRRHDQDLELKITQAIINLRRSLN